MPRYPSLARVAERQEHAAAIADFIDWLTDQGLVIRQSNGALPPYPRELIKAYVADAGTGPVSTCGRCGTEYTGNTCPGPGYHP